MIFRKAMFLLVLMFFFGVASLSATEEYAGTTGQDCSVCHLAPSGGGELTAEGEGYALSLGADSPASSGADKRSAASRLFQLFIGYLHILFGFFWFGTILYVHLILKPAYASRGLPRGEVKLGLLSMVIMGVTGAILFVYRVPDAAILLGTQFGLLLLFKMALYLIMVCSALFAVFFLGPRLRSRQALAMKPQDGNLSLEDLVQYDGKEGRKACFAYRGEIYDATESPLWKNGTHMGRHQAGSDLTEALSQAPHGEDRITKLKKISSLQADLPTGLTPQQKVFYTMAYMNLGFVLLIILILACWNWL